MVGADAESSIVAVRGSAADHASIITGSQPRAAPKHATEGDGAVCLTEPVDGPDGTCLAAVADGSAASAIEPESQPAGIELQYRLQRAQPGNANAIPALAADLKLASVGRILFA